MAVVVELPEWSTRVIEGLELDEADRRLCSRLASGPGPRLLVDELRTGVRFTARSWVGVVQLSRVRLHVVPKLAGEALGLVRMLEWTAGLDPLRAVDSEHDLALEGASLLDLVALLLVRATEQIIRTGLRSDYVTHEQTLGVLRGRLLVERQLRRRHGRLDRLECRFDERTTDIFDNQLLLAAAGRCATRARDVDVRRRAARVRTILAEACDAGTVALPRRPIAYDRLNRRYRPAHELAWTVLEGTQGLDDLYTLGATRSFAFLLDMNRLFERFVERVLQTALAGAQVQLAFQTPTASVVQRADGTPYMQLIPDTVAATGDVRIPVDAKYKRYSTKSLDPADVAQSFLYASGIAVPAPGGLPHAMIVYPSETGRLERAALRIRHADGTHRAALTALGVPVARLLEELAALDRPLLDGLAAELLAAARGPD